MNLHKFYLDSQINAAILSLLTIPLVELTGNIQKEIGYLRDEHAFDFESHGKPVLLELLKTKYRKEVMIWMENNEEINRVLVENDEEFC